VKENPTCHRRSQVFVGNYQGLVLITLEFYESGLRSVLPTQARITGFESDYIEVQYSFFCHLMIGTDVFLCIYRW